MTGRRHFLRQLARLVLGATGVMIVRDSHGVAAHGPSRTGSESEVEPPVTLFLCGDVMLGRGIDQILAHPSDPALHEDAVRDARKYVALAEAVSGRIPHKVDDSYVWGDALAQWQRRRPDVRIVNLETSIARKYSRFIRAMLVIEIPFGQTASHSPSLEQLPNPSASCRSTIATTRVCRSILPWGSSAR